MHLHTATLIYPHQLYADHPGIAIDRLHVLIEDTLFFGDPYHPAQFHKQKLMLHRASMKRYQHDILETEGFQTEYIDYQRAYQSLDGVFKWLMEEGYTHIHVVDPTDYLLERRIRRYCTQYGLKLVIYESPNFLTETDMIDDFFQDKDSYHQTDYYIFQRKRLNILLTGDNQPEGGRWTYDTENRRKLGRDITIPDAPAPVENEYIREARAYVESQFPQNPGSTAFFIYPTSHTEAENLLDDFLQIKLHDFGPYQDAITTRGAFLFHSLLSAPLNTGLLSPQQIIDRALDYYHAHRDSVSLASIEGFIRQIIGWREFIRAVYLRDGTAERTANFWDHQRRLDDRWYTGDTGIIPLDDVIHKLNQYAYAHHIERLMIVGNFMVLCEIHPDDAYRWFMEMFIDAYDWVMVPNVYGMSLYADGGLITTKPYISSSNYIRKMSDYKKADWMPIWDGLYWRFIHKHRDFFAGNPRLAMMTSHLKRMSDEKLNQHLRTADQFLNQLDRQSAKNTA